MEKGECETYGFFWRGGKTSSNSSGGGGCRSGVLGGTTARAQYLTPSAITVQIPSGSNNGTRNGASATTAYVDDVLLSTIKFGSTTYSAAAASAYGSQGSFGTVRTAQVTANRPNVNAEFGDLDTGSDGNANPFVKAGVASESTNLTGDPNPLRESTDPNIQDKAIAAAFSSRSLVEGVDGETDYTMVLIFNQGIVRDGTTTAADNTPELLFFERGLNSQYTIRGISGRDGTGAYTFFNTSITIDSGNAAQAWATGIFIDTIEINTGQELGATGISTQSLGVGANVLYGVEITSINASGADIYGTYLSAASASQFRPGLFSVPEPPTGVLALLGFLSTGAFRASVRKMRRRRRQG